MSRSFGDGDEAIWTSRGSPLAARARERVGPGGWQCHRPVPSTDAGQRRARARAGQRTQQCLSASVPPGGGARSDKVEDLRLFDVGDCPNAAVSAAGSAAWQLAAAPAAPVAGSRARTIAHPYLSFGATVNGFLIFFFGWGGEGLLQSKSEGVGGRGRS